MQNEFKKQLDIADLQQKKITFLWYGACAERSLSWNQRRTSHENIAVVKVRDHKDQNTEAVEKTEYF